MPTTTHAAAVHDLTGRTAVVTGASSGIGAATARALAAGGARRMITPIPADDVAEAIAWSAAAPARVNVAELIVLPTAQG
jgi:NADP-dependent 3-hydroxy acid dehydrogenase YdfG